MQKVGASSLDWFGMKLDVFPLWRVFYTLQTLSAEESTLFVPVTLLQGAWSRTTLLKASSLSPSIMTPFSKKPCEAAPQRHITNLQLISKLLSVTEIHKHTENDKQKANFFRE